MIKLSVVLILLVSFNCYASNTALYYKEDGSFTGLMRDSGTTINTHNHHGDYAVFRGLPTTYYWLHNRCFVLTHGSVAYDITIFEMEEEDEDETVPNGTPTSLFTYKDDSNKKTPITLISSYNQEGVDKFLNSMSSGSRIATLGGISVETTIEKCSFGYIGRFQDPGCGVAFAANAPATLCATQCSSGGNSGSIPVTTKMIYQCYWLDPSINLKDAGGNCGSCGSKGCEYPEDIQSQCSISCTCTATHWDINGDADAWTGTGTMPGYTPPGGSSGSSTGSSAGTGGGASSNPPRRPSRPSR